MKRFQKAFGAFKPRAAAFFREKGYYIALMACIAIVGVAAAFAFSGTAEEEPPAPSDAPASQSSDERLEAARTPAPTATPAPSPTVSPTPIADFTPAPAATKAPARKKASPPVQGEVIWGFAVDSLLYSRTLDQWMTHVGVDVAAPKGTEVYASFGGTVEAVYTDDALGVTVEIAGGNDLTAVYANLKAEPPVREGARVNAGDLIGYIGDTAVSECGDKSHLHFELHENGAPADPADFVLFEKSE